MKLYEFYWLFIVQIFIKLLKTKIFICKLNTKLLLQIYKFKLHFSWDLKLHDLFIKMF